MLVKAALYARTLRNLRARQLLYLPLRRLQRRRTPFARGGTAVTGSGWEKLAAALPALSPVFNDRFKEVADDVCAGRYQFLNHTETLPNIDWSGRYVSPLWTYNLHYFDYAVDLARAYALTGAAKYAHRFEELARSWIEATASATGDGWDPYPISLRTTNWVYAMLLFGDALSADAAGAIRRSLHQQLDTLERRLEWHLFGNHVLANLKSLLIGGLAFDGDAPDRWRRTASRHLADQLGEQVLPDGVHIERAPMYHAIVTRDLLELYHLGRAVGRPPGSITPMLLERMAAAALAFSRSDGSLHLLQDSANGVAPAGMQLAKLAGKLAGVTPVEPNGMWSLTAAGYYGYRGAPSNDRIVIDAGPPGPPYQPGHAHCSMLSYELELNGVPTIVDSGVSGYDADSFREYVRSTRAHNSVVIQGREQSEIWGTFRMARRAHVVHARASCEGAEFVFDGACTPYFDRRIVHRRVIEHRNGVWTVTDTVTGCDGVMLESLLHLHPDFEVELHDGVALAVSGNTRVTITPFGCRGARIHRGERNPLQGWYCPEFGRSVPCNVIEFSAQASPAPMGYRISAQPL